MGAMNPRPIPIWTNALGQRNGLIVRGRLYRTGHVLCHHIIINMGIDDDMIDVILTFLSRSPVLVSVDTYTWKIHKNNSI